MNKIEIINNLNKWIENQRLLELSNKTLIQYQNSITKFIKYLTEENINLIDKKTLIKYKEYLNKISNSANSKNLWIISLNKYLKYLGYSNLILKQFKTQNKFYTYDNMTFADYKRLLRIAKRENMTQDYLIMKVLAMTGIRVSELEFFTIENLKLANDNILRIQNKGKERDIPLRDDLARELRKYSRQNKIKKGYIFRSYKNQINKVNPTTIWKHLKKISGIARVKTKVVHAHSFRHLFADKFLETYPGNVILLAEFLGHSSLETTRIYVKKTLKQKKEMLAKLKFK